ncbi:hypothetical protein [Natrononativus amylolyticus]|uniref:hypothetical protein n=1 Tax=Natrononativus amylolyticus TaxID=2963434 RepID=UPI0020CE42C7|nr:hypothetical protein [Natrononativus amylolyticus]
MSDDSIQQTTRRTVLKATAGALGVVGVGGVASGHKTTTDGDYGDQFDGVRANAAANTEVVGYHSAGGIGSAAFAGSPDDPHYGAFTELRVHDDLAVVSAFSSRDETPGRGMAVLDVGQFTRAESREELEDADLTVLSFYGNENDGAACMDVKLSDDGQYAFVSKQPLTALFDETELDLEDDDADSGGADGAALEVVDISDPGNPEFVTQTSLSVWALGPHNAWYHQIGGREYVFTTHGEDGVTGGINVFEFDRDLGTLEFVNWWNYSAELAQPGAETDTDGGEAYAHDIVVQDDPRFGTPVAYLANWNAGTRLLDVSDPTDIEELGVFEQDRAHHTVPAPTLQNGKRVFVAGHENPSSHEDLGDVRTDGETGHYYLVDADPIDEVLAGERDEPVYLGASSTLREDGVEAASRTAFEMYEDNGKTELDYWILFESTDQTFDETPGFEAEAEDGDHEYEGFDDFNLSAHNLDIDADGNVVAGHYHAGTRFMEITDEFALEATGYSRVGPAVPEDATLEALSSGTPFHWSSVMRNGVAFSSGINEGPQAIAHDDIPVGEDTPIDLDVEREADASLFTAGQTSQVRIHVDSDEPVQIRDRIPGEWEVVGGDVSVAEISDGDRKVVTADEPLESGTVRYFVEVPSDLLDTGSYTVGPVEYARPDVESEYGGGVSVTNFLWRKENGETVTKTVAGLDL